MNQTDSMMFHAELLRDTFLALVSIEYSSSLEKLNRQKEETGFDKEPTDDEDPRLIDPGSLKFEVDVAQAFKVAQDVATTYCAATGFCEEIPLDDRKRDGAIYRATVPRQFRGGIPAPGGGGLTNRSAGLSLDEGLGLQEKLVQLMIEQVGCTGGDSIQARRHQAYARVKVSKVLRDHGIPVPPYAMPPEQTGRKPMPWETDDEYLGPAPDEDEDDDS